MFLEYSYGCHFKLLSTCEEHVEKTIEFRNLFVCKKQLIIIIITLSKMIADQQKGQQMLSLVPLFITIIYLRSRDSHPLRTVKSSSNLIEQPQRQLQN